MDTVDYFFSETFILLKRFAKICKTIEVETKNARIYLQLLFKWIDSIDEEPLEIYVKYLLSCVNVRLKYSDSTIVYYLKSIKQRYRQMRFEFKKNLFMEFCTLTKKYEQYLPTLYYNYIIPCADEIQNSLKNALEYLDETVSNKRTSSNFNLDLKTAKIHLMNAYPYSINHKNSSFNVLDKDFSHSISLENFHRIAFGEIPLSIFPLRICLGGCENMVVSTDSMLPIRLKIIEIFLYGKTVTEQKKPRHILRTERASLGDLNFETFTRVTYPTNAYSIAPLFALFTESKSVLEIENVKKFFAKQRSNKETKIKGVNFIIENIYPKTTTFEEKTTNISNMPFLLSDLYSNHTFLNLPCGVCVNEDVVSTITSTPISSESTVSIQTVHRFWWLMVHCALHLKSENDLKSLVITAAFRSHPNLLSLKITNQQIPSLKSLSPIRILIDKSTKVLSLFDHYNSDRGIDNLSIENHIQSLQTVFVNDQEDKSRLLFNFTPQSEKSGGWINWFDWSKMIGFNETDGIWTNELDKIVNRLMNGYINVVETEERFQCLILNNHFPLDQKEFLSLLNYVTENSFTKGWIYCMILPKTKLLCLSLVCAFCMLLIKYGIFNQNFLVESKKEEMKVKEGVMDESGGDNINRNLITLLNAVFWSGTDQFYIRKLGHLYSIPLQIKD